MALLSPALRARLRRATRPPAQADPGGGELNITPFLDVVVNLVLFLLATSAAVLSTSEVEARLPDTNVHGDGGNGAVLTTSVTLTAAGAIVSSPDGILGPGCTSSGIRGSVAVPSVDGALDRDALARCAAVLHDRRPTDRQAVLGADPTVPYADLVAAMDALRGTDEAPYFPEILLSAGVR